MKLAYCGDDCASCPRYTLQKDQNSVKIAAVKALFVKVGWMTEDFPLEKIPCGGCKDVEHCEYGVKECCLQQKLAHCGICGQYPCENIVHAFEISEKNTRSFCDILTPAEYGVFERAYFQKKHNLEQ